MLVGDLFGISLQRRACSCRVVSKVSIHWFRSGWKIWLSSKSKRRGKNSGRKPSNRSVKNEVCPILWWASTSILFLPINLAKLSRTRLWFIVKEIVGITYILPDRLSVCRLYLWVGWKTNLLSKELIVEFRVLLAINLRASRISRISNRSSAEVL